MENTENNEQNESNNDNELKSVLNEILPLLEKIQVSHTENEKLIDAKSKWDDVETKLLNANTKLQIKYSELQSKIRCSEKTMSELPEIINSLKSRLDNQLSENMKKIAEQWDETAKEISDYARKFPQAFVEYSNENLIANIEEDREELVRISEEIKQLKFLDEELDNSSVPHDSLITDLSKCLEYKKSINSEVKRRYKSSTENLKILREKKKNLQQSIDELKKKLNAKEKEDLI